MDILTYERIPAEFKPWTNTYLRVAEQLIKTIQTTDLEVIHIGSTSAKVGGKGIIDLSVLYQAGNLEGAIERVKSLGFQDQVSKAPFPPERPRKDGLVIFDNKKYLVHIHIIEHGSSEHKKQLYYKEYMLSNIEARRAYENTKRAILAQGITDQEEYGKRKSLFVKSVLNQ